MKKQEQKNKTVFHAVAALLAVLAVVLVLYGGGRWLEKRAEKPETRTQLPQADQETVEVDGVTYYFLDNEYYFKRRGLYGFYDDGERFAFFSRAVLETLFYIDFTPDIINCNDWQTALVPVYLNLYYRHLDKFNRIKTIFTIHNIAYQGKYGTDILEDTCGIGRRDQHIVEYDGCANFMKGAIETADKITTVSPTYAQEILDPWFSYGLDALLREKQYKLCGILNGIDTEANDPATDPHIAFNYDVNNFEEGKAKCKEALQDKFGLDKDGSPVFAMVSRMVGMKGFDLVQSVADGLVDRGIELVILGSGENVSPEELEKLLAPCAAIRECRVCERNQRICAVVCCEADQQDAVRDFVTKVNRTLPLYKHMVVEFSAQPLPRNAAGKLLRS